MNYWTNFVPGELVDVWRGSGWIGCSRIDDMTSDGSTIWLVDIPTGVRTLHMDTDGITLMLRTHREHTISGPKNARHRWQRPMADCPHPRSGNAAGQTPTHPLEIHHDYRTLNH